jgi:alginate O-acetyltransferase complex protein AlgJ
LRGESANDPVSDTDVRDLADGIKRYADAFARFGVRMVFMPVPNKENIYYRMLPAGTKPQFLDNLLSALRNRGVDVIDLQPTFRDAYENKGQAVYHTDDTHWNSAAVRIAAAQIGAYLVRKPLQD